MQPTESIKRPASEELDNEIKRKKIEKTSIHRIFEDEALEKYATDLYRKGSDNTGYISGIVFMTWPVKKKARINFETVEGASKYRFDVEFSGGCTEFFDHLQFSPRDVLKISLRGAKAEKMQASSAPNSLPMMLRYVEGVALQFVARSRKPEENGLVVSTWELREQAEAAKQDWFTTPRKEPTGHLSASLSHRQLEPMIIEEDDANKPSCPPHAEPIVRSVTPPATDAFSLPCDAQSKFTVNTATSSPDTFIPVDDARSEHTNLVPAQVQPQPPLADAYTEPNISKKKSKMIRRLKKLLRNQESVPIMQGPLSPKPHIPNITAPSDVAEVISETDGIRSNPRSNPRHTEIAIVAPVSIVTLDPPPQSPLAAKTTASPVKTSMDPALDMKPGLFSTSGEVYTPINDLVPKQSYNVIGIANAINPPYKTAPGDWCRTVVLVDPSNYNPGYGYEDHGYKINCFTRDHKEWLPSPEIGDVLMLQKIRTGNGDHGNSAVGYKDKLRWAVYTPSTGKVHHGNIDNVPRSMALDDGFGYEFSPFFSPSESEIRYCLQIGDWWQAIQKEKARTTVVYNVGTGESGDANAIARSSTNAFRWREHRLICDAGPDVPPRGFFDCTVEVLHGHRNDNEVYSLYVTDYTINDAITPTQAEWCPTDLANRVLKIEMWDPASNIGPDMHSGEYYSMLNVRMKVSRGGHVEGTITEAKITKLDETNVENQPRLKELLRRKAEWGQTSGSASNPSPMFEHRLIEDIEPGSFFNCVVEALHVAYNPDGVSWIYVTDYTYHPDLPSSLEVHEAWTSGLQGHIVKIALFDRQAQTATGIEPGSFYQIKNLRLKKKHNFGLQGRLGGDGSLINKLKTNGTDNEKVKLLISRREAWQRQKEKANDVYEQNALSGGSDVCTTHTEALADISAPFCRFPNRRRISTIKELLLDDKSPNKFNVVARVIDFYPLQLEDCVFRSCSQCGLELPAIQRACFSCADFNFDYVQYQFRFFFRIEDEEGTRLEISVSDIDSPPLKGLTPSDLREQPEALKEFSERLRPLIGNLIHVHERLHQESIATETPLLMLTIDAWHLPNVEGKVFGLADFHTV